MASRPGQRLTIDLTPAVMDFPPVGRAVRSAVRGGDAGGEGGVADRARVGLGAGGAVDADGRLAEGAGDGRAVLRQRRTAVDGLLEVGEGDARVLLLQFGQQLVAQDVLGARLATRGEPTEVSAAVSTGSVEFPDQLTRVTARVPESTRTTGRTKARVRPIRRAGPRPRRVCWFMECFTRVRVAPGNGL